MRFVPAFPIGGGGVIAGAALVFFAYIGFDTVTVASEEAHDPVRDVPRAVIGSLVIGIVIFMAAAYVTVGIVPWQTIDPNAAMSDAVKHAGNAAWLNAVVFVGAFAGTTTVMLTSLLGQCRIFYVMARDRMLPPVVARVDARTNTPVITTLTTGVLVAILAGVLPLADLLALVNVGTLSAFAIVCAGVFVLRLRKPDAVRPFRAPFGLVTAALGVALVHRRHDRPRRADLDPLRRVVRRRRRDLRGLRFPPLAFARRLTRAPRARVRRSAAHRGGIDRSGVLARDDVGSDGRGRRQRDAARARHRHGDHGLRRDRLPAAGRALSERGLGLHVGADRVRRAGRRLRGLGADRG